MKQLAHLPVTKFYMNIDSPDITYSKDKSYIISDYRYTSTCVEKSEKEEVKITTQINRYLLKTSLRVPKAGLLLVGWGGNNGATLTCGIIANKLNLTWETRLGKQKANYLGSILQCGTMKVGRNESEDVFLPFKLLLPLIDPNDLILGGWDISGLNLVEATRRAQVLEPDLVRQLEPHLKQFVPKPAVYYPDFVAANQAKRADNVIGGADKFEHLTRIRQDIRQFKEDNALDIAIVVWTATTERFTDVVKGCNDTADNILNAVKSSHSVIAPSTVYALAAILEGSPFINGSPQNTFVPGVIELARNKGVLIAGDDFKSGQTKVKTAMTEFLVGAGIKPLAITSYNHLGNNDGANLSAPSQFRSKEISKSSVIDDAVLSNPILFPDPHNSNVDHTVVIKYVPSVGDSKRAMDEYYSEIFMGGRNTIAIHNVCEDSLLAVPLIIDLAVLAELLTRIKIKKIEESMEIGGYECEKTGGFKQYTNASTILGYLLKAPLTEGGAPAINCLGRQRAIIENLFCMCLGINNQDFDHVVGCV